MIERRYQTAWPRIQAAIGDGIVFAPVTTFDYWYFQQGNSPLANLVVYALVTTMSFYVYSVVMHGCFGKTLGKMMAGVVVQGADGSKLGIKRAFMRDSVIIIFALVGLAIEAPEILEGAHPYEAGMESAVFSIFGYASLIWFLLEIVSMFTNKQRRAIHDFIGGSVVVREDV
jgi:uncharacterized RDD family membrane protein YckC